jgi:multicomponent K+:H+ antiporter subunit C
MELLLALTVGVLTGTGVYLLLRARSFDVILGLTLVSYAVNVFIFLMGRVAVGKPPILTDGVAPALTNYADPLPQALVLTAIVISFAMTALMLVIALRTYAETGSDHVDGVEPMDDAEKATATNAAQLSAGAPAAGEARR